MRVICIFLCSTLLFSCSTGNQEPKSMPESTAPKTLGAFMGMSPIDRPLLLSPDLLGSSLDEYNGTFSPDGKEFFFTTNTPIQGYISQTKMDSSGTWSEPRVASFSGEYSEYDPLFSPDGSRLYFSSERPAPGSVDSGRTGIWYVEREEAGWSKPKYVDLGDQANYFSSVTNEGIIYFNSWDTGDLYRATPIDSEYEVEALPEILNTENGEGDPFISSDEDYLIFRGYNNTLGRGDHYISFNIDGEWTEPQNLGEPYNSSSHEMCPYVTRDGKYFIFASTRILDPYLAEPNESVSSLRNKHASADNGQLNIYYVSADFIEKFRTQSQSNN